MSIKSKRIMGEIKKMKLSELEAQLRAVEVAQQVLANTWKRLKKAQEKIEMKAQQNEGEITETEAQRHEKLHQLEYLVIERVVGTMNLYQ